HLRDRKKADPNPPGRGLYRSSWVADVAASGDPDLILGGWANEEYEDVYDNLRRVVSYEAMRDSLMAAEAPRQRITGSCILVRAIKLHDRWHAHASATMMPVPHAG